ncbi:hypothetical protein GUITHDRAFT_110595 [Guillardia theta CCMP2712]|uniref:Uncharacterized protein n=1 Tax=Guillardia theta (strain CCMP2712) TaxID=905079 RepID=L1J5W0_GUITC|nr:hypothetical protein GUITHDRAFT_110595 [Guillardia theta CCMP2712]EKX43470.1 hypothetical protein GUITHDRAFT_110595 [Guillardia theta CCMP2712]|eukprot:XP_005830450.1 hypothetical protein GUITHDRAFT_110595 [Guillardia theta CCMP2712]
MPHAPPPPPTFSIALVSLSLSRGSSPAAARPPRAFKLSPSQQAYVDAHSPPSEQTPEQDELQELQQGKGPSKRVSVSSAGRELLQGVLEARKARATARTSSGRSWREEGGFVESLEDVTEMARAERWA